MQIVSASGNAIAQALSDSARPAQGYPRVREAHALHELLDRHSGGDCQRAARLAQVVEQRCTSLPALVVLPLIDCG